MQSQWEELNAYFRENPETKITADPADPHVFEDPRDSNSIISINLLIKSGTSEEKLKETAQKIQALLDTNGIAGIAMTVQGAAQCTGIKIVAEQPLPKSLGIRSVLDGVPIGFSLVRSLDALKKSPSVSAKTPGFKPR